ncbi:MAG: hypothetical protein WCG14_01035 [Chlamydiia bacterium]
MKNSLKETESITRKYAELHDCLTEQGKRLWAGVESLSFGHRGVLLLSQATSIDRSTIHRKRSSKIGRWEKKSFLKNKKINELFRSVSGSYLTTRSRNSSTLDM